jgi:hypothetical protein
MDLLYFWLAPLRTSILIPGITSKCDWCLAEKVSPMHHFLKARTPWLFKAGQMMLFRKIIVLAVCKCGLDQ